MNSLVKILITATAVVVFSSKVNAQEVLTWQDSLKEAAKNNPQLIIAQEEIVQQKASYKTALSNLLPLVTADASANTSKSDSSGSSNSFGYGVSASQLLFDGFVSINNLRSSSQSVEAEYENFKFSSVDVRFNLRQAFVNLLKAQELLTLSEEIYKIRQSNLDLINLSYESGTEHKGALLTAKANLSQAAYEVNQAKRNLEVTQQKLIKELGRKEFLPITVQGDFDVTESFEENPDFETLTLKHPSYLSSVALKNAAEFDLKSAKGELFPTISVSGDIAKSGDQWTPDEKGTSAGVRVSLPIFEGGANLANITRNKSILRQKKEQERSSKDTVIVDLKQKWSAFVDAVENVKVQEGFLNATQERVKISQQQYSIGLISFDNWIIIEDDLVRNKKAFLEAQSSALLAEADWIEAKGETLEYEAH